MSPADWASAVLLPAGAVLCLLGAVGLVAFPDLLTRLHAAAKAQTAGLLLLLCGAAAQVGGVAAAALLLVAAFQLLTAPAVAQAIGRVAYREGVYRADVLVADEPTASVIRSPRAEQQPPELPPSPLP
ncbi:monovalent cation/H(+) antiporter subunit G [Plantactinospora sp. WMMC1484]|uniref:monovalent cation/H(+) antiporter subunit G n=1 Tax=Plantactinospora sp. WMMC1484 TaxID=3404122 RepID=UPI003BF500A9